MKYISQHYYTQKYAHHQENVTVFREDKNDDEDDSEKNSTGRMEVMLNRSKEIHTERDHTCKMS